ncbi:MAG: energy transducer TonB [Candidatus Schekmanbacteria bacterium]|nr:MAG: energy transducer TonB [Candidatus Schekmanbacteria bacterium]
MFDTLVESGTQGLGGKRWLTAPISLIIHGVFIGFVVLFPILFPNVVEKEAPVVIVAPPAPPPPPPPPAAAPQQVAQVKQAAPEIDTGPTVVDESLEVPEEVANAGAGAGAGVIGGVIGGGAFGGGGTNFLNEVLPEAAPEPEIPPPRVVTADMEKPVLIDRVAPVYPSLALKAGIEGTVILKLIIGITGKVESAQVLTVVPPKARGIGLEDAAIQAVLKWRFKPAKAGGKPVRVYYNAPVRFKLN